MDDYMIDEQLLQDIQETPTPYPTQQNQYQEYIIPQNQHLLTFQNSTQQAQDIQNISNHSNSNYMKSNNNHANTFSPSPNKPKSSNQKPPSQRPSIPSNAKANTSQNSIFTNSPSTNPNFNNKDYLDLEKKYISIYKQFDKLQTKYNSQLEELKLLKIANDALISETNKYRKAQEIIVNDKQSLETQWAEQKAYCRKVETKLAAGAKNQNVIEINNKLRTENEAFQKKINLWESEKDDLLRENSWQNDQIFLLNKTLNVKAEEWEISPDDLSSLSNLRKENENLSAKWINISNQYSQIMKNTGALEQKIQELTYAKDHLTQLWVTKDNEINNMKIENDSFKSNLQTIQSYENQLNKYEGIELENENLKKYICAWEKQITENKEANIYKKENDNLKKQIDMLSKQNVEKDYQYEELMNTLNNEKQQYSRDVANKTKEIEKYKNMYNDFITQFNTDANTMNSSWGNIGNNADSDMISYIRNEKDKNIQIIEELSKMNIIIETDNVVNK